MVKVDKIDFRVIFSLEILRKIWYNIFVIIINAKRMIKVYKQLISDFIDSHKEEMLGVLSEMIEIQSVRGEAKEGMPYGEDVFRAFEYSLELAKKLGFKYENFDNRINIISCGEEEKKLGILCHLDVVDVNEESWETPPFKATVKDNMIYARGAYDNKGAAVAAIYALYALKSLEIPIGGGVGIYLGTDEESGSSDFELYLKNHSMPHHVFVPDAAFPVCVSESGMIRISACEKIKSDKVVSASSGTQVNIIPDEAEALIKNTEKSEVKKILSGFEKIRYEISEDADFIKVKIFGKSTHASRPSDGVNAASALLKLLAELDGGMFSKLSKLFEPEYFYGEGFGFCEEQLTLSFSVFDYDGENLTFQTDSRVNLGESSKNAAAKITDSLPVSAEATLVKEPHSVAEDEFIVKTLMKVYKEHTNRDDLPYGMKGLTYAHDIENAVVFGMRIPSDGSGGAHGSDEHCNVDTIIRAAKIYADAIIALVGVKK